MSRACLHMISTTYRWLRGDARDRPFVDAPLVVGEPTDQDVQDSYALSGLQHGMLIHSLQAQRFGVDIEQIVIEMREDLQVPAFREAWRRAVERHDILRTVFDWEGSSGPRQLVRRHVRIPWAEADWRGLSAGERRARWERCLLDDRGRSFDLRTEPPIRLALVHEGTRCFRFLWTFHHI